MNQFYQGLVDAQGRPIEKKLLTQEVAAVTVSGVRSPITDYPSDGLTPPRLNAILKEADQGQPRRFYELAEQIEEKDLHYSAVRTDPNKRLLAAGSEWRARHPSDAAIYTLVPCAGSLNRTARLGVSFARFTVQ